MNPRARIVTAFDPKDPDFVNRSQYIELWGGLGDIFNHIHWVHCYQNLSLLGPGERAYVVSSSHNSCAYEIFAWHPKAESITVLNCGFHLDFRKESWRQSAGFPVPLGCSNHHPNGIATVYYPPEEESPVIKRISSGGKYLVFSLMASDVGRSVPRSVSESALRVCIDAGYRVVLVGRNYENHHAGRPPRVERLEHRFPKMDGLEDMIDLLSVPGTAELVHRSSGVLTCHSAICMLSWHLRRPTFLLVDPEAMRRYFPPYHHKYEGYSFGGAFPENDCLIPEEYDEIRLAAWLKKVS